MTSESMDFKEDLMQVNTKDNKNFTINIHPGAIRSDGTPFSLDDILFTYQDIVIKNKRWIRSFTPYKDISH
jgi:ABC-type transport system substrate-binding protein